MAKIVLKRNFILICLCICFLPSLYAQEKSADSSNYIRSQLLKEVEVQAYISGRSKNETPAAINTIGREELQRYAATNVLSALNATPGVRMEERSPGSYRLSIRGSSLRSPFGVRNVKVYYAGIPVSDPGGFSYFNQFAFTNTSQIEIIKGPGSSLYGAGNGGVLLISPMAQEWSNGISLGSNAGAYGFSRTFAELRLGDTNNRNIIRYEHMQTDAYRTHAAMNKESFSYDSKFKLNTSTEIGTHLLYNQLNYQTPGALTETEYNSNPQNARPNAGSVPGSESQNASVAQRNFLAGISNKNKLSKNWENNNCLYLLYSKSDNPTIRNFTRTTDPHFGGRTTFHYTHKTKNGLLHLLTGIEAQQSIAAVGTFKNKNGIADTLISNDEISSSNILGFGQLSWQTGKWTFETGLGWNNYTVSLNRISDPSDMLTKTNNRQTAPRFAALYKIAANTSAYLNIARGFSPPTTAELAPSGSALNPALKPEYGWNYEAGIRGNLFSKKLSYDISAFYYELNNAIVQRKDSAGGDTYINAGGTRQSGIEARIDYSILDQAVFIFNQINCWASFTGYQFQYRNFVQGSEDFSGKRLPGTAANTVAAGIDIKMRKGFNIFGTYYYSSKIALNDANTAFAKAYHLLGVKAMYRLSFRQYAVELFAGADNLLNEQYSLGNDINAAGGRYFNAAPPLNVYGGLVLHWLRP